MHPLEAEIVVSILPDEPIADSHRLADEPRKQRQAGNQQRVANAWHGRDHDSVCAGTSQRVNNISTGQR